MSRRRLVPLALGVTLLLVVVAIAARGRPLGKNSSNGGGLPVTFWDYVFTTLVILEVFLMIGAVVTFFVIRRERTETRRGNQRTFRTLMILVVGGGLLALIAPHLDLSHLHAQNQAKVGGSLISGAGKADKALHAQHVRFQWKELVLIAGILLALVAAAVATRKRLAPATARRGGAAPEVLAAALDESLDDLRNDPDLRRAIIAAYARMETAFAAAGLPRHEAETPFEYLERALLSLDTSAPAVHRLTDLFEWARFSHHEPEPWMRDEAVEALVAVRDELRASDAAPVALPDVTSPFWTRL